MESIATVNGFSGTVSLTIVNSLTYSVACHPLRLTQGVPLEIL